MNEKILVVEDDPNLLETLKYNLEKEGYVVLTAVDGEVALQSARRDKPDLIILDLMLPKLSGLEVCRAVRKEMATAIIMLTARAEETDKIVGLEIGADDYMTKPFSLRELTARVRALLRRLKMVETPTAEGDTLLTVADIEIDISRHLVSKKGKVLELTPKEFDLLVFLVKNKSLVFSRDQLLERVWGYEYAGDTRTVDVHVSWLRRKIEADPAHPRHLLTVRGVGYKFEA